VFGENEDHNFGLVDRPNDLIGVERPRHDVSRRNPTSQAMTFQNFDNRVGRRRILGGVTDEYVGRAIMTASPLLLAAAFSHVDPLLAFTSCWQKRSVFQRLFCYADVERVLLDVGSLSSQRTLKPDGSVDEIAGAGMLGTDPPRLRHLRSRVIQAFTQKRVAQLEPRIRTIAAQLLDEMAKADTPDLVAGLAFPLPVMVIGELLGVPAHDAQQLRPWAIPPPQPRTTSPYASNGGHYRPRQTWSVPLMKTLGILKPIETQALRSFAKNDNA
jgi:hypothetical protein